MFEILAIAYVVLSAVASIVALSSPHFERHQAILQSVVAWLLPYVGAIGILVFHSIVYKNMNSKAQPDKRSDNDTSMANDYYSDFDD